jgi:predicted nucleic acid-binding protein
VLTAALQANNAAPAHRYRAALDSWQLTADIAEGAARRALRCAFRMAHAVQAASALATNAAALVTNDCRFLRLQSLRIIC